VQIFVKVEKVAIKTVQDFFNYFTKIKKGEMKRWEKLENAFREHLEKMTDADWETWVNNSERLSEQRHLEKKIESLKHALRYSASLLEKSEIDFQGISGAVSSHIATENMSIDVEYGQDFPNFYTAA
jgi:hypothetical protein